MTARVVWKICKKQSPFLILSSGQAVFLTVPPTVHDSQEIERDAGISVAGNTKCPEKSATQGGRRGRFPQTQQFHLNCREFFLLG